MNVEPKKRILNTSDNAVEPSDLMIVSVLINDQILDVRGSWRFSFCSTLIVSVRTRNGRLNGACFESLRFAGGQVERAVGIINLPLTLSEDLEIRHTFLLADNPFFPSLLGLDFILSIGCGYNT